MKRSKFSEAQIAFILRQAEEGTAVGEVCRKAGISEATYYNWRNKYAGLMPSEMKRLRQIANRTAAALTTPRPHARGNTQDKLHERNAAHRRSVPGRSSASSGPPLL